MDSWITRARKAWNVFTNRDPTYGYSGGGQFYTYRPDRPRLSRGNERTIVNSIFNHIALSVADINIQHCKLDENGRFLEVIDSELNKRFNFEANIDQSGKAFIQDIVISMLDEGSVALVPIDTDSNLDAHGSFDILSMRTGKIEEWYPDKVRIRVYNDRTGQHERIMMAKDKVAIIENPLYSVVNEPNSTLQRLIRKLRLLDAVDEQTGSGKLDMIIQLPFSVKGETRKSRAEERRKDLEQQLANSKYGIGYIDATERITQLNRPVENNLLKQIEYLTNMLYSQLGITQGVLDGTADEKTMLNYYNSTIKPIVVAIVDEIKRKFLTKTARSQRQSICFFRDHFKLVPVNELAEAADKFTRNEIMSKNEFRQVLGLKPSSDPKADQLINSNIAQSKQTAADSQLPSSKVTEETKKEETSQNGEV